MQSIFIVIQVLVSLGIIILVLMQHGKGADVGATFGSGASNTMFGSQGSMPFLMKITVVLAALFFATSLTLTYLVTKQQKANGQYRPQSSTPAQTAPAQKVPQGVMDIPTNTTTAPNAASNAAAGATQPAEQTKPAEKKKGQ